MNPTPSTPEKSTEAPAQKKIYPKPKKAKKTMAKKKVAKAGINKSEEIRKLATELKAKGEKVRPVTIQTMLRKRGIEVAAPQVSMVLKGMGFRPRKRRKSGEVAAAKGTKPRAAARSAQLSIDDLLAAKKIVEQFGGADRAIAAIAALKRFEG